MDDTVTAERQITFDDLLTPRAGLNYGETFEGDLKGAYERATGGHIDSPVSPDDWIAGLASLPLIAQPGAGFTYGHGTDLLGMLIARIEGVSLGEVLQNRVFGPLGMKDTGFSVPTDKHTRRAAMYGFDANGALMQRASVPGAFLAERPEEMAYQSGGQGLWSTVDDLLAFGRIFVGGGAVDGVRILSEDTLKLMTTNRLTPGQRTDALLLGMPVFEAHGFGLGLAVVMDPAKASPLRCQGEVGTVGWPGAYGGWWQADPTDGSVMVFLAHNSFELEQLAMGVGLGVYGAIMDFHSMASRT
jgi:CubicO group peptidase (beta-lactamase class C family)